MKTKLLLSFVLSLVMGGVWAQGPNGSGEYYKAADGKCGAELKTALFNIIKNPSVTSYKGLYSAYVKTDTRADGFVRDWYSNATNYRHNVDNAGNYSKEGDMYNREHSIPQSWFSEASPMVSDVVHVLPTDGYVNNRRSSYLLAEVSSVTYSSKNNYSKLGSCKTTGYSGTVFEPNDEIKGDMARIYFYMATCYQDKCTNWTKGEATKVFSTQNKGLTNWVVDMFMDWSKRDLIDDVETARNNAVQEVQGNRNPFVDYPGLEEYIWGDKQDVPFSYDNYKPGEAAAVAKPVFSPEAGTYYESKDVTITCKTAGAKIYYTINGGDPSEQSTLYEAPITLDQLGTYEIKAIAINGDDRSALASATYVIAEKPDTPDPDQPGGDPSNCEIALNNTFFGTSINGVVNSTNGDDFTASQDGIDIVYALGTGSQRMITNDEIRVYKGNTVTFSVSNGTITKLEFTIGSKTSKLTCGIGSIEGNTWTGNASSVSLSSADKTSLKSVKITVNVPSDPSGIDGVQTKSLAGQRVIYDLSGRRVTNPSRGIYIVDGRMVVIQ
jgi:endonuclease I